MKPKTLRPAVLCTAIGILNACTTAGLSSSTAPMLESSVMQTKPQMRASDRILYWLEEARELHDMATHREREAELILMTGPGPSTNAFVKHMRVLAHQLNEVAQYADQQAKEAEAEISPEELQQLHFVQRWPGGTPIGKVFLSQPGGGKR